MVDASVGAQPLKIGILGAGGIATIPEGVLPNIHHIADKVTVVAIADTVGDRALAAAERYGIPGAYDSLDGLLENQEVEAVVNLTPIPAHAETSMRVIESGRHLVVEKPIATTMAEANAIIDAAKARDLTLVVAPPDMLYGPYREGRRMIDAGTIGKVAFARVRSSHAGPGGSSAGWPLDPTWFYQEGSGPLFDMGVYGIHEITGLLGPAKRVTAFSGITEQTRVVRGGPFAGKEITVTADDNSLFMLDFGNSTFAVIDGTYNVLASKSPKVEIFGRRGVMNIYNPNGAKLELFRTDLADGLDGWIEPASWPESDDARRSLLGRATLVEHLADCVRGGSDPVLSAEHARHALEIMLAIVTSAREDRVVELTTTF